MTMNHSKRVYAVWALPAAGLMMPATQAVEAIRSHVAGAFGIACGRRKWGLTALALLLLCAATRLDLWAQCATACPPPSFASDRNYAPNPDFEIVGPCGPNAWIAGGGGNCILGGVAWSAAQGWKLHGDNAGSLVQSTWEPSTLPIGGLGRMLHIRAKGPESGVLQQFVMPPGAHTIMFSAWVKVMSGNVAIGTNAMVNAGPYAFNTKIGEWEQLRVCTSGNPADMLFIYNENFATGAGEFYVDRVEVRVIN